MQKYVLFLLLTLIISGCSVFKSSRRMDMGPFAENTRTLFAEAIKIERPFPWKLNKKMTEITEYREAATKAKPVVEVLRGIILYSNQIVSIYNSKLSEKSKINLLADEQILQRRLLPHRGIIRAGGSKNIIYHPEAQRKNNVCIFHPRQQGVNYVSHPDTYWDYSHGSRFLLNSARVIYYNRDGSVQRRRTMSVDEIYRDRNLYRILSPSRM